MANNLTRINNNQITSAISGNTYVGINANAKVQPYSITSSLLANSFVYGSDFTVTGNLTVQGTTTTVNTTVTLIQDPIVVFADGQTTGTPVFDIGVLGYRGNQLNSFIGWKESSTSFVAALSNTVQSNTTVNVTSYANFTASTIVAQANLSVVGNILGTANFSGNINGANILTTGLMSATANITGGNIITSGLVTATGNVTAGNIVTAGLVTATGTIISSSNIAGGNLTTGGQVSAVANITGGNILTAGIVSATANVIGGNVLTSGIITTSGNIYGANLIVSSIESVTGNISGGNLITAGLVSAAGTGTFGNIQIGPDAINDIGTNQTIRINSGSSNTNFAINGTAANIFYLNAASNVVAFGNSTINPNAIASFNAVTSIILPVGNTNQRNGFGTTGMVRFNTSYNSVEVYNNGGWANVGAPVFTVIADEQITSANGVAQTFTLTNGGQTTNSCIVSINGIVQIPTVSYAISGAGGNILTFTEAPQIGDIIDIRELTTTTTVTSISNGPASISANATPTNGEVDITGNLVVTGTITATGGFSSNISQIVNGTSNVSIASSNGNVTTGVGGTSNVVVTASTGQYVTGIVSASGNATAGNILTAGQVSATANITGGNVLTSGLISATGTITSASTVQGATVSATANVTGGNLLTGGIVSTSGNIYGANLIVSSIESVTGTITGGNIATGGTVSATGNLIGGNVSTVGNVTANYLLGNAYYVTGLSPTNIYNGTSNVTVTSSGGNVSVGIGGTSNVAVYATTGQYVTGLISATANVTGGNITTAGQVSATANITGGNVLTGGQVSATGNINGGNLYIGTNATILGNLSVAGNITFTNSNVITTNDLYIELANNQTTYAGINNAGLAVGPAGSALTYWQYNTTANAWTTNVAISATANVTGGNVLTGGIVSSTGNAIHGNVLTGGIVSSTGNITGGNLSVGSGTITVGNIVNAGGNGTGNIGSATTYFNQVFAKATSAVYADLAEKYTADAEYAPGTVVVFGGSAEVTVNAEDSDRRVAGVVSTNPSYIMNGTLEGEHVATVALTGRVPTMVVGPVRKRDLMVAAGLGRARAEADPRVGTVIGKALEDFEGTEGTIEVVVGRF